MKGLIIADPWVGMITSGDKTWELRSRNTTVRGRIALIKKGSGTVVGVAELVGTRPKLLHDELKANVPRHRVPADEICDDLKHSTAWVFEGARALRQPVAYRHPPGAVIWVNLNREAAAAVEAQLSGD
jgi:hypothetical protein